MKEGVTVRQVEDEEALLRIQGSTCRHFACEPQHRVIAIHGGHSHYKSKCHHLARNTGGRFSSIEEIEGKELFAFVGKVEDAATDHIRLERLVDFAAKCMTAVRQSLPATCCRGEYTKIRTNTRNRAIAEVANSYLAEPSSPRMRDFLDAVRALPAVQVARVDLFNRMMGVLNTHVAHPDLTLGAAAERYQSQFRYRGRPVGRRRLIGTTLLVKGLEFDHAIVLDATSLSRRELYVALTRGARSLTIIATAATLHPGR